MSVDPRITSVLASWDWGKQNPIPASLPLLDEFTDRFPPHFSGCCVLFIQHHLGSTVPMVRAFMRGGAARESIWYIDVPYSTDPVAHRLLGELLSRGEDMLPLFNDPLADYSTAQTLRTAKVLREIAATRPQSLVVVDDGAYFLRTLLMLEAIGDEAVASLSGSCVVEQTTRGHRFLESHRSDLDRLGIVAVSVARSHTKLQFEAPFVGACVAAALMRDPAAPDSKHVLALGYGAVGQACVRELRRRLNGSTIIVVDPRAEDFRARIGGRIPADVILLPEMPSQGVFDLILGCTGTNSFTFRDAKLARDGAVLASASSADIELGRHAFVEVAERFADDEIEVIAPDVTREHGIHARVAIRIGGQRLYFANAGFPVNFDGRAEGLSVEMIQPTRCLLLAGALQASTTNAHGLWEIGPEMDYWLLTRALSSLA
jgi:hypothetical protein